MTLILTLASRNLFHDRVRLIATVVGIVFSIVLVSVQLGVFLSFERMVTTMIDHAQADFWIVPGETRSFEESSLLAGRERLQALSIDGVTAAIPVVIGYAHQGQEARHWYDAEMHRTRGEILLAQNPADPAPAEAAFLAAIAVAQQQKARSFELRAALSLAKLYQSTGRPSDAHDVLGPALAGFSPTPEFAEIAEAIEFLAAIEATGAQL